MANMHVEIQYVHLYCLSSTQNEMLRGTNVSGDFLRTLCMMFNCGKTVISSTHLVTFSCGKRASDRMESSSIPANVRVVDGRKVLSGTMGTPI